VGDAQFAYLIHFRKEYSPYVPEVYLTKIKLFSEPSGDKVYYATERELIGGVRFPENFNSTDPNKIAESIIIASWEHEWQDTGMRPWL
jgi:hypothetical protein